MRFIFGILVGFAVMIAGAYVHDQAISDPAKRLVNWEVAGDLTRRTVDWTKAEFDRLTAK